MKQFNILIPIYDWQVVVFTNVEDEELPALNEFLESINTDLSVIDGVIRNLKGSIDAGSTINNSSMNLSIVCLTKCRSEHEVYKILSHEVQHVMDHISSKYAFMDEVESKGYLIGFIYKNLSEAGVISEMLHGLSTAVDKPGLFVTKLIMDAMEMAGHLSADNYREFLIQLQKEFNEYISTSLENLNQNSSKSSSL